MVPHLCLLYGLKEEQYGTTPMPFIRPKRRTIWYLWDREGVVKYVLLVQLVYGPQEGLYTSRRAMWGYLQKMYPIYAFYTAPLKNNLVPLRQGGMVKYVPQVLLVYCSEEGQPTSLCAMEVYLQVMYPTYTFYATQRKNNMVCLGYGRVVKFVLQVLLVYGPEEGLSSSPWDIEKYMQRMYPTYGTACILPRRRTIYFSLGYGSVYVENVPHLCHLYCPKEEQSHTSGIGRDS